MEKFFYMINNEFASIIYLTFYVLRFCFLESAIVIKRFFFREHHYCNLTCPF